jgi:hypothetical protein
VGTWLHTKVAREAPSSSKAASACTSACSGPLQEHISIFQNELRNPVSNHYLSDPSVTTGDDGISYSPVSLLNAYERRQIGLELFFLKSPGHVAVERMLALDEKQPLHKSNEPSS